MIQIELDGVVVPEDEVEGEEGITISIIFEDEGGSTVKKRVTGTMEFRGHAFDVIKAALIDAPGGKLAEVSLRIFDDCEEEGKEEVFTGVISGDLVGWCEGACSVKCTGKEKTVRTAAQDCMLNTVVFDDRNGFLTHSHPRMVYCDELRPDWLQHMQLIVALATVIAINSFTPIVMIFAGVINSINLVLAVLGFDLIDFDGNPDNGTPDLLSDWYESLEDIRSAALGCGRRHPSPLVRDYIENVCAICDIEFRSTIFKNPASDYHNTVYVYAPAKRGMRDEDAETFIRENRVIKTLDRFLADLQPVFNAKARIITTGQGPVLYFERRDEIPGDEHWLNVDELRAEGLLIEEVCYEWSKEEAAASLNIHYIADGVDVVGNEGLETYTELVSWNTPAPNATQRGIKELLLPFGIPRFRRDGVTDDIRDNYRWLPGIVGDIEKYSDVMLMQMGVASVPRLIIWDGLDTSFGVCRKFNADTLGYEVEFGKNYNYPYHLHEYGIAANTIYPSNAPTQSIYARFHTINNPRVQDNRWQDFAFTFEYKKAHLANLPEYPTVTIGTNEGQVREITINLTQRTIFVQGSY